MSLINSTYFIGEKNIPNTTADDVSSLLTNMIAVREREFLIKLLGYELFKLFEAGLQQATPDPIYVNILMGLEFTGFDGMLTEWRGLISLTTDVPTLAVNISASNDLFFTVGVGNAPVDGDTSYVNAALAGMSYRVVQRGFGPLEQLAIDNSNIATADIMLDDTGGFTWLNGVTFDDADKFSIEELTVNIDVADYTAVTQPESPIADYVYYWWLRNNNTQTAGIGEVKSTAENAVFASPAGKMVKAWNDMVEKIAPLHEYLMKEYDTYPSYTRHANCKDRWLLHSHINEFGL